MRWREHARPGRLPALLALWLAACATEVARVPVALTAAQSTTDYVVAVPIAVSSSSRYERRTPAGSRWRRVGRIEQGEVYQRIDDVFSIEGAHMHEAFLVVASGQIVGFYLPVEKAYSPALSAVPIDIKENKK